MRDLPIGSRSSDGGFDWDDQTLFNRFGDQRRKFPLADSKDHCPTEPGQGVALPWGQFLLLENPWFGGALEGEAIARPWLKVDAFPYRHILDGQPSGLSQIDLCVAFERSEQLELNDPLGIGPLVGIDLQECTRLIEP